MAKMRSAYPPEFWCQMVELVRAGRSSEELARESEPSAQSIGNWFDESERKTGRCDGGEARGTRDGKDDSHERDDDGQQFLASQNARQHKTDQRADRSAHQNHGKNAFRSRVLGCREARSPPQCRPPVSQSCVVPE